MTSSSGVTGARDQSPESNQSVETFWRVADRNRQIFAGTQNCPMKNWAKAISSELNQVKKLELCCDVKKKEIFVQMYRR